MSDCSFGFGARYGCTDTIQLVITDMASLHVPVVHVGVHTDVPRTLLHKYVCTSSSVHTCVSELFQICVCHALFACRL